MNAPPPAPNRMQRFTFDTVFDGDQVIAPAKPRKAFAPEEVEAVRAAAFAEGQRSALAQAEAAMAHALAEVAHAVRAGLGALSELVHAHRSDSARLALGCARKIADAALDHAPEAPARAALEAMARELDAQPRLLVRAGGPDPERLRLVLEGAAEAAGYPGLLVVKADPALPRAGFVFDWGEGRARFDPATALARVEAALETALAAEGLHAEPIPTPGLAA